MKIIIIGDGKLGSTLAQELSAEGHAITLVDNRGAVLENTVNSQDIMGIQGNGASYDTLMDAGVSHCDLVIAATSTDELNLLCCIMAKKLGTKSSIARVRNPDYSKQVNMMQDELGIGLVVNPEREAAREITRNLRIPSALDVDLFARGRVELIELKVGAGTPLENLKLSELNTKFKASFLICAVSRGNEVFIPTGNFELHEDDHIHVTASPQNIQELLRSLGIVTQKIKNVIVIGGGRTTVYLTRQLFTMGIKVTIIEKDEDRCRFLCEQLPKATVILGDGTDPELLEEEGIRSADAFIALTGIDEQNIIISMYAEHVGNLKIFTKIDHILFPDIVKNIGLESIVSPTRTSATQIVRFVRAMQNSLGTNVETLHKLLGGRVEALEFVVRHQVEYLGIPLKDLKLKPNILLACIIREGEALIPRGYDTIELHDRVVVVSTTGNMQDLRDILE